MGDVFDNFRCGHRASAITGLVCALVAGGCLLLSGCGGAGAATPTLAAAPPPPPVQSSNWPTYGLDGARTRYLPTDTVKPPFRIGWKFDPGKLMEYSPIVVGDRIYGIDNNGLAFA